LTHSIKPRLAGHWKFLLTRIGFKKILRREKKKAKEAKAKEKSDQEVASMFSKVDSGKVISKEVNNVEDVSVQLPEEMDDDAFSSPVPLSVFESPSSVTTRLRSATPSSASSGTSLTSSQSPFPKIPVRFGRKTLNPKVMVAAVHVAAKYDISLSTTVKIFVDLMNMVCDREWTSEAEFAEDTEEETNAVQEVIDIEKPPSKKQRKVQYDLTYRFPSRQTLSAWLRDGAILSLKFMADSLINKEAGAIVTWGTDDTIKKAGHRVMDSKSNHITVMGPNTDRHTFTTGFDPNLSHKGSDSAFSINTKLKMLSGLSSCTVEDINSQVNFWMGDRADDVTKVFEILGIESGRVLRCSAHISVGADVAVDKVFKQF
jgi:hypothetical protein